MIGLGVNIDHVATIRQARRTVEPDPIWAATEAELGGADCITFHLRKDRRHINDRDADLLRQTVRCKLNMEMSLDDEIVQIAMKLRPDQATLVPENRQEITTEGGLDVAANIDRVRKVTEMLRGQGIIVSAFIEPYTDQIHASAAAGCQAIEIHTGSYANAKGPQAAEELNAVQSGLRIAIDAGLIVHAGHGLTYNNVRPIAEMEGFTEFNIGHSIVSRAVFVGMRSAVREMKEIISQVSMR